MQTYIKVLIFSLPLLFVNQIYSQKFTDDLNGIVNIHKGYNLPEYKFFESLANDYVRSLDISLYKKTTGKNTWEQLYNYPDYGMSLFYSTLGNDDVLGREIALTYFVKVYFSSKNRFKPFIRTGIGLDYVNRKFDLKTNYLNVAVGSNVNIHFNFRVGANYAITDKWSLNSGLSLDHFSNANTSEPNLGVNSLTGYAGVSFCVGEKTKTQIQTLEPHTKENTYAIFASMGGKHSRALVFDYFLTSSLSFEFERSISRMFHLGIGSDIFYDSSVKSSFKKNKKDYKNSNGFQSGIHLSQSLIYNKVSFSIQEGVYLFLTEKVNNHPIYFRGLVQYQISNNFLIRIAMKSYLQVLDYPEIGLGYKF